MVGTTVGTGNIWRYPRILASNAEEGGWYRTLDKRGQACLSLCLIPVYRQKKLLHDHYIVIS